MQTALTEEQAAAVADFRFWVAFEGDRRRAMVASGVPDCEARAWAKQEADARERIAEETGREAAANGCISITLGPDGQWKDWQIHRGRE